MMRIKCKNTFIIFPKRCIICNKIILFKFMEKVFVPISNDVLMGSFVHYYCRDCCINKNKKGE